MAKSGLTQARFETYTSLMEHEAHEYLKRLGDEGELDFFTLMSEMTIFTATRCLHGKEVRDRFDETVAQLYADLDHGFTPLAWFMPAWIPFPSFRIRDRAHDELARRFKEVIQIRKQSGNLLGHDDMLETFMTARYD
jgi:sterol 14alpha-demethylase